MHQYWWNSCKNGSFEIIISKKKRNSVQRMCWKRIQTFSADSSSARGHFCVFKVLSPSLLCDRFMVILLASRISLSFFISGLQFCWCCRCQHIKCAIASALFPSASPFGLWNYISRAVLSNRKAPPALRVCLCPGVTKTNSPEFAFPPCINGSLASEHSAWLCRQSSGKLWRGASHFSPLAALWATASGLLVPNQKAPTRTAATGGPPVICGDAISPLAANTDTQTMTEIKLQFIFRLQQLNCQSSQRQYFNCGDLRLLSAALRL